MNRSGQRDQISEEYFGVAISVDSEVDAEADIDAGDLIFSGCETCDEDRSVSSGSLLLEELSEDMNADVGFKDQRKKSVADDSSADAAQEHVEEHLEVLDLLHDISEKVSLSVNDREDEEEENGVNIDEIEDPKARQKALRKAEKKRKKKERREQREGRGDKSAGQKECNMCSKKVDLLIRCTYDESAKWRMVCGKCWHIVSGGVVDGDDEHPYYRYGGLWKNRRRK